MFLNRGQCRTGLAALLMTLGGCGEEAPPNPLQVAEQAERLQRPLPGRYRSETRLTGLDLPRAGEGDARLLRARLEAIQPQVREFCLSGAEAEQGFAQLLRQMQDGDCRIAQFNADKGSLKAELQCTVPGNVAARIRMTGTAGERTSQMDLSITQEGPAIPGGRLLLDLEVNNRLVGSC